MPALRLPALCLCLATLLLAGCGGGSQPSATPAAGSEDAADPGMQHVHGLGVNPADGALHIATHHGLFRLEAGQAAAERVGESMQDVMGFTVVGPDSFLASGHPDPRRAEEPPLLGLLRSDNGGRDWRPVALRGEADFHVLRAAGSRVYGYDSASGDLLASTDEGATWERRRPPGPLLDFAVDPRDPTALMAATPAGLLRSRDAGASWRPVDHRMTGLLAWPQADRLFLVAHDGRVLRSSNAGGRWRETGGVQVEPAAFTAEGDSLYLAGQDGSVSLSRDAGATWRALTG